MMKKAYNITKEGLQELEKELQNLIAKRGSIAERIKTARDFGDLAENSEYATARQEQEEAESRISEIENILKNAQIIKKPSGESKVQLGSCVKLKAQSGQSKEFQVVGTVEADPMNGKISDESPIGRALLGKKVGESVEIKTPAETVTYKVADIS